ncbi:MAG: hypothetical protein D4R64_15820 [Porphyromonadaceae bacterium]|nr:MAG: hypothetical protein D4R64_15820 [Porphyromonadaceae bacterium]
MKNSIKITVGVMAMMFAVTEFCFSQESTDKKDRSFGTMVINTYVERGKDDIKVERRRTLDFKNESKKAEVKVNMTEEYNYLKIKIISQFNQGSVILEIVDPKGEKQGTYTAKSDEPVLIGDKTSTRESVNVEMEKTFNPPLKGEWIIRAIPASATGYISITITQQYI